MPVSVPIRALLQQHQTSTAIAPARGPSAIALPVGRRLKRGFDVVGAAAILLVLLPVLPLIAIAVWLDGGQALYSHARVGFRGRTFGCLKYRTMVRDADARLAAHLSSNPEAAVEWATRRKLARDPRVTRIGAILRATSLDELPQLINVLSGSMSLVGPRPVVADELDKHYDGDGRAAYLASRPGVTGLWQVSGRSGTSYDARVDFDTAYARGWSLWLDLKILARTIPAVLTRRGAV